MTVKDTSGRGSIRTLYRVVVDMMTGPVSDIRTEFAYRILDAHQRDEEAGRSRAHFISGVRTISRDIVNKGLRRLKHL